MTSDVPGNTTPGPSWRARSFQFTLNQPEMYKELSKELHKLKTMTYIIACEETAPTTGHKHVHAYVHFSHQYRLSKKLLSFNAHIEICRGSPKQNIDYIRKDGNIIEEWGEVPRQGIKTVSELRETPIDEVPANLYRIKKQIEEDDKTKKDLEDFWQTIRDIRNDQLKGPEVIYITGPSGSGKTYMAYKEASSDYEPEKIARLTIENNFIDVMGADDAECFVIEEFRPSQMTAASFLQLTDKYGFKANVKGGWKYLHPKKIIICSIIEVDWLYTSEMNKQFQRRITKLIDLNKKDDECLRI